MHDIGHAKQQISGAEAGGKLEEFTVRHDGDLNPRPDSQIKQQAGAQGMDVDSFKKTITDQQQTLGQEYSKMTSENANQYEAVKYHNEAEARDLEKQVKKYEEDRIGKGDIAKGGAWVLDKVTGGRAGSSIGKPDADKSKIDKGAYENAVQTDSNKGKK